MQKLGREQEVSDNASTLGRLPFIAAACIDFVSEVLDLQFIETVSLIKIERA
ncbi:hypothetical protein R3W88_007262 [Solanum pinnatisectum]|uniref:Uncharacterized protein n=1 Tax=Solanum pinnatisectum TaxID=50273 RepID=A0AAV9KHD3_9SOLN|nr:hypothetical protein R3W88_007262 [Solanum pinnatisectum]